MKKLLTIVAICLLCFSQSQARMNLMVLGGQTPATGGSCTTETDSVLSTNSVSWGDSDDMNGTYGNTTTYRASKFTIAAQSTITEYKVRLYKVGAADSFTVVGEIWTHDDVNDEPEALVSDTTSNALSSADITEDVYDDEVLTLATPKTGLASGTYWLVVRLASRTSGTGTWAGDNGTSGGRLSISSDSGASWAETANQIYRHQVFGCAE